MVFKQPELKVYAYRNDELLFETTNTAAYIAKFLTHYIFEENKKNKQNNKIWITQKFLRQWLMKHRSI